MCDSEEGPRSGQEEVARRGWLRPGLEGRTSGVVKGPVRRWAGGGGGTPRTWLVVQRLALPRGRAETASLEKGGHLELAFHLHALHPHALRRVLLPRRLERRPSGEAL
jgi:hypothetical protein